MLAYVTPTNEPKIDFVQLLHHNTIDDIHSAWLILWLVIWRSPNRYSMQLYIEVVRPNFLTLGESREVGATSKAVRLKE